MKRTIAILALAFLAAAGFPLTLALKRLPETLNQHYAQEKQTDGEWRGAK